MTAGSTCRPPTCARVDSLAARSISTKRSFRAGRRLSYSAATCTGGVVSLRTRVYSSSDIATICL